MADVIQFPSAEDNGSARLGRLRENGELDAAADAMGSREEWAWSAVSYLKGALTGTLGGTAGGSVNVSAAAVGLVLGYVEHLAGRLGIIGTAAERPQISDAWIAERWPDQDAAEVRRRFDALIDKLDATPWRGIPRYPDVMQPVLAWAAMLPSERIEALTVALAEVPGHLRDYLWIAKKPAFGEQSVKYMDVTGDDGHGMGKQAIAITPYVKGYNIAPWIAAASPGNVGALLGELERLRAATPPAAPAADASEAVRQVIAQIVARAYGGSLCPGVGEPDEYPTDAVDYRAADAILSALRDATPVGSGVHA